MSPRCDPPQFCTAELHHARLQRGGGLSVRMNANVSLYANADTNSPSATPTAAGATGYGEPLVCDLRGEFDLRLNLRSTSKWDPIRFSDMPATWPAAAESLLAMTSARSFYCGCHGGYAMAIRLGLRNPTRKYLQCRSEKKLPHD